MKSLSIVTSFIRNDEKFLVLKRSNTVKTMKCMWSAVSGVLEKNEEPMYRAKIEILEEVGITQDKLTLVKSANEFTITSTEYNQQWNVFSFLFNVVNPTVKLNWENSEFRWINSEQLKHYNTVPDLEKVLFNLL